MGWFDPPHTAVIKKLPVPLLPGAHQIERTVGSSVSHLDATDQSFCIVLALASWVDHLEERGQSGMDPRQIAYVMEAARLAVKGMRRKDVFPYIDATIRRAKLLELLPEE